MTLDDIKVKILAKIDNAKVVVTGDGCNCATTITAPVFVGMSLLARQRMVLAIFKDDISSGQLHALSITTHAP